jgi:hypothetical protein
VDSPSPNAALAVTGPGELTPVNIGAMKAQVEAVKQLQREILQPNEDYGIIPGTGDKPTLLKPGAEKLINYFQLRAGDFEIFEKEEDDATGHGTYKVKLRIFTRGQNSYEVGFGVGACSTRERKYRNADPWITRITALKMAKKRALVDAALTTTAASGIFTQDVEELAANGDILPGGVDTGRGYADRARQGTRTITDFAEDGKGNQAEYQRTVPARDPAKVYQKGNTQWKTVFVCATQEGTSKSSGKPFLKLTAQVEGADYGIFIWHNMIEDYKRAVPQFPYQGAIEMMLEDFGDKGDAYAAKDFRQASDFSEVSDDVDVGPPLEDGAPCDEAANIVNFEQQGLSQGD